MTHANGARRWFRWLKIRQVVFIWERPCALMAIRSTYGHRRTFYAFLFFHFNPRGWKTRLETLLHDTQRFKLAPLHFCNTCTALDLGGCRCIQHRLPVALKSLNVGASQLQETVRPFTPPPFPPPPAGFFPDPKWPKAVNYSPPLAPSSSPPISPHLCSSRLFLHKSTTQGVFTLCP